ncbi:MAG: penicillin-binding protein 2 [Cellulomonadaceae bacterium]|jgi:peptidoglycan glycosyltransferase|nr:penicillin-binding protein 2 [Cellulomonadaceae bacterium]
MNKSLRRIATIVTVLFIAIMASTTWIQFHEANSLNNNGRNVRRLYREYGNHRGPIMAQGTTLAESVEVDSPFGFQRRYMGGDADQAQIFAPVTGFFSIANGTTMIENTENAFLNGQANAMWMERMQDLFMGRETQGASVELTLNPAVQKAAWDALGGQRGAVVAVEPATGKILAMVSKPSFNPNDLAVLSTGQASSNFTDLVGADNDPLINRTIGALYPPGSSFKLIPAAAALETGYLRNADQSIPAPHRFTLPGTTHDLRNFGDHACSSTDEMSLHDAMVISCNTAFASLGVELGGEALRKQAQRFGFDDPFEVPMRSASSSFPDADGFSPDRVALASIGQGDVTATPLQMAMVSAAIANDGILMQPYLVDTVRDSTLDVIQQTSPKRLRQAVGSNTVSQLAAMMEDSVSGASGTATAARIPGVRVAGKTGTAQAAAGDAPHAWFTAFAPVDNPQIAVAVIVEHGGDMGSDATGGRVAAPVVASVIRAVLQ